MAGARIMKSVKLALRITNKAFDGEITGIIEACKTDLKLAGVINIKESDPLILRAVTLYAKANFGFNEESEKYQRSYDMLKCSLCLGGDYNGAVERNHNSDKNNASEKKD